MSEDIFRDEKGNLKFEIKIGMVIDDYKMPSKDVWWDRGMKHLTSDMKHYKFVREEIHPGITPKTMSIIRYYQLIEN